MNTTPLLQVNDLTVHFHTFTGTVQAVRGVNFSIYPGETVALVGESGCGKSVTAQSLLQLVPHPPGQLIKGEALFDGKDLLRLPKSSIQSVRGKDIGMVFQDPMTSLNPTMRVGEQIMEVLMKHQKMNRSQAHNHAIEMLEMVKISDPVLRMQQYPFEFSGGMRQRVMIALALACRPKLLIADEPTTALDVTIQAQILELMQELQKKLGTSIILITHDLGIVSEICDRVVVMYAGQVVEEGSVQAMFSNPQHPYTRALLDAVPKIRQGQQQTLKPIRGIPPDLTQPPKGCAFCARCDYALKACVDHTPSYFETAPQQQAACWLHHEYAKGCPSHVS